MREMISENGNQAKAYMLSDHSPFLVSYEDGIKALGWNILCQAKYVDCGSYNYFNNGFGCDFETDGQYKARLALIAQQLRQYAKEVDFFTIQEAPESAEFHEFFIEQLSEYFKSYHIERYYNEVSDVSLLSFYCIDKYEQQQDLTRQFREMALKEGLEKKCLPTVVYNKISHETYLLVSVHADYAKEVMSDVIQLEQQAITFGITHILMLGDCNRSLMNTEKEYETDASKKDIAIFSQDEIFNYFEIQECIKSSFCFKESRQILESQDGHISSKTLGSARLEVLGDLNQKTLKSQATPSFFLTQGESLYLNSQFDMDVNFFEIHGVVDPIQEQYNLRT